MTRLVFLHGLGDDVTAWDSTLREEALSEFNCIAVNAPGFGDSPWNGAGLEGAAKVIWDEHGGGETVVIGHSMGGTIATILGEWKPDGLLGIVNVEGNLTRAGSFLSSRAVAATDFENWWARFVPKQAPRYRTALERCDPQAFLAYSKDLYGVSIDDAIGHRYRAVEVPKLYIHGNQRIEATIGNYLADQCKVGLVGGHWIMEDDPAGVARLIAEFVTS